MLNHVIIGTPDGKGSYSAPSVHNPNRHDTGIVGDARDIDAVVRDRANHPRHLHSMPIGLILTVNRRRDVTRVPLAYAGGRGVIGTAGNDVSRQIPVGNIESRVDHCYRDSSLTFRICPGLVGAHAGQGPLFACLIIVDRNRKPLLQRSALLRNVFRARRGALLDGRGLGVLHVCLHIGHVHTDHRLCRTGFVVSFGLDAILKHVLLRCVHRDFVVHDKLGVILTRRTGCLVHGRPGVRVIRIVYRRIVFILVTRGRLDFRRLPAFDSQRFLTCSTQPCTEVRLAQILLSVIHEVGLGSPNHL